jgi:outer membrane receptor protein involved in Fe transport
VDPVFKNLYLYNQFDLATKVNLTLGLSYESFDSSFLLDKQINPKFGLTWEPMSTLSFRMAYMENLVRPNFLEQSIEPTQVAGFNQINRVYEGSVIQQTGIGFDTKLNSKVNLGADFERMNLDVVRYAGIYDKFYNFLKQDISNVYFNWTPTENLGLRFAFEYDRLTGKKPLISELKTKRVPIGINYYWSSGAFLMAEGIYTKQKMAYFTQNQQLENFWNFNITTGYRFPNRYGKVELIVNNLLDKQFGYYESTLIYDTESMKDEIPKPIYWPGRQLFLKLSLNF